jgi:hypothetical protein
MLVIALLLISISTGGNTVARLEALQRGDPLPPEFPNLYAALATLVPGLNQIRGPAALYSGVHMALCVIAGVGAAGILRAVPKGFASATTAGLVLLTWVELMRPSFLGLDPRIDYRAIDMRPPAEELAFHQALLDAGSKGPLLELPFNPRNLRQSARATLLSAWHGRRTSQCYNSYLPPELGHVKEISDGLPDRDAVVELSRMGFSTILLHVDADPAKRRLQRDWRQELVSASDEGSIVLLRESDQMVAYEIVVHEDAGALPTQDRSSLE